MDLIVEMRFGSHLYGTATSQSDLDYKAVYLPEGRDILLQRVQNTIAMSRGKAAGEKNVAGDVDRETHTLQRYLGLLAEGQTMALDMLFAPDSAMTREPTALWREIQANAPRLVTRQASAFVRYCRQQANKYGNKGSRLAAARQALQILAQAERVHGATAKLSTAEAEITALIGVVEHVALLDLPTPGGHAIRHLEVCGKKMSFTSSIKSAREIAGRLVDEYGQRALQAERNDGIDWKALSHAVRVGREAVELFKTGRITFPLPSAAEILAIKRGDVKYEAVARTIDALFAEVEAAAESSFQREQPDRAWMDEFVAKAYREKVMQADTSANAFDHASGQVQAK